MIDSISAECVERLKYLPQDHVETVCNELVGSGERSFEQELKSVIFSHVPEVERLGQTSLDELVRFHTGEKQKRIDSLFKQLREIGRSRALLEVEADPKTKRELEERIKRREIEIKAHDSTKPVEIPNPSEEGGKSIPGAALLQELGTAIEATKSVEGQITQAEEKQRKAERRQAVANRLIERLNNFKKDYDAFLSSLTADAAELDLQPHDLISLTVNKDSVESIWKATAVLIAEIRLALDEANPGSLRAQLKVCQEKLSETQAKLDAPNRAYQEYLKWLGEWQAKRAQLEGSASEPESLLGMKASVAALSKLPEKISALRSEQIRLALEIHSEKQAQAEVYRNLYGPVQKFINSHELAKDKLNLEFRAELTNQDFADRLLGLLALNRRGSFMGVDEGRAKVESFTQATDWDDAESISRFLELLDQALHEDQRENPAVPVQLRDQLLSKKKIEEVFDLLYGLEYIEPRYILRWDGKELSMLSPGERGTLLLVFYLLIDKGDMPLVIDQPEGNLDNHTVARVLVDCIREARKRRQVFLVTHNPNLAVVCDADQVVYASMDKSNGNAITYSSGSLENPDISQYVTDVLEGTRWAFGVRRTKYEVGEQNGYDKSVGLEND